VRSSQRCGRRGHSLRRGLYGGSIAHRRRSVLLAVQTTLRDRRTKGPLLTSWPSRSGPVLLRSDRARSAVLQRTPASRPSSRGRPWYRPGGGEIAVFSSRGAGSVLSRTAEDRRPRLPPRPEPGGATRRLRAETRRILTVVGRGHKGLEDARDCESTRPMRSPSRAYKRSKTANRERTATVRVGRDSRDYTMPEMGEL